LARGSSSRAELFRRTVRTQSFDPASGQPVLFEPDPLVLAVALEPEIIQRAETRFVEIELASQLTRGQLSLIGMDCSTVRTILTWYMKSTATVFGTYAAQRKLTIRGA